MLHKLIQNCPEYKTDMPNVLFSLGLQVNLFGHYNQNERKQNQDKYNWLHNFFHKMEMEMFVMGVINLL